MIFAHARPKPAIVGRLRKLHREWASRIQGEPHAIRGWWCFRGAA